MSQVSVIEVEKLLCKAIGREWSAAGISIVSLVDELKNKSRQFKTAHADQIAAEDREKAVCQIADALSFTVGRDSRRDAAEALYEAGYRKQVQP
jgi:hypothetical protein